MKFNETADTRKTIILTSLLIEVKTGSKSELKCFSFKYAKSFSTWLGRLAEFDKLFNNNLINVFDKFRSLNVSNFFFKILKNSGLLSKF